MSDGTLDNLFNSLAGRELPGGCELCHATQTMREDENVSGVWVLVNAHDDNCPTMRARDAGSN